MRRGRKPVAMGVGARLRRAIRLVLALAVCTAAGLTPQSARADEVRMSIDEARGAAARALMAGQADLALVLAEGCCWARRETRRR